MIANAPGQPGYIAPGSAEHSTLITPSKVADWIEQNWRGLNGARQAMEEVVSMLITQKDAARKKIDAATQGTPERSIALGEWLALVTATERVCAIFAGRPTC